MPLQLLEGALAPPCTCGCADLIAPRHKHGRAADARAWPTTHITASSVQRVDAKMTYSICHLSQPFEQKRPLLLSRFAYHHKDTHVRTHWPAWHRLQTRSVTPSPYSLAPARAHARTRTHRLTDTAQMSTLLAPTSCDTASRCCCCRCCDSRASASSASWTRSDSSFGFRLGVCATSEGCTCRHEETKKPADYYAVTLEASGRDLGPRTAPEWCPVAWSARSALPPTSPLNPGPHLIAAAAILTALLGPTTRAPPRLLSAQQLHLLPHPLPQVRPVAKARARRRRRHRGGELLTVAPTAAPTGGAAATAAAACCRLGCRVIASGPGMLQVPAHHAEGRRVLRRRSLRQQVGCEGPATTARPPGACVGPCWRHQRPEHDVGPPSRHTQPQGALHVHARRLQRLHSRMPAPHTLIAGQWVAQAGGLKGSAGQAIGNN